MRNPYTFVVSALDWQVFATLTFGGKTPSRSGAERHLVKWLGRISRYVRVRFDRWIWLARFEHGEVGKRLHVHLLIHLPREKVGYFVVPQGFTSVAHRVWGCGLTSFRKIEGSGDPAVAYCLKGLSQANAYEMDKTARANDVVMSVGLVRKVTASLKTLDAVGAQSFPALDTGGNPVSA